MKKLFALVLLVLPLGSVFAEAPRSWNHDMNPALLSVRNRRLIEIGVTPSIGLGNSYFTLDEVLVPNLVIDLNAIYGGLQGRDLQIGSTVSAEAHLTASLFGITAATYSTVNGVVSGGIPNSLLGLIAEGHTFEDQPLESSSRVVGRVFADMGVYAGVCLQRDWYFGMKAGAFAPIFYTDRNSNISFGFSTDQEAGTTTITGSADITAYSAVNFEDPNIQGPEQVIALLNGRKVDFGVIRADGRKPIYGANISGITLKPAVVNNMISFSVEEQVVVQNPLGNFDGDTEDDDPSNDLVLLPEDGAIEPTFETNVQKKISMPLQLGGFYRVTGLPLIDVIGHGQLYFADPVQYTVGAIVEGSFFPLNIFSLGVEYDRALWKASAGLKLNLWLMELGLDVGFTSPTLGGVFRGAGASAKIYFAMGI